MDEVDDNESTIPWDSQSQSLAGFTEDIIWDDDDDLSYHSVDDVLRKHLPRMFSLIKNES